jgi:uncharacterized protein YbjT (DUF2867 family)
MARILVTGGAGGLGREIVNQLITTPHTVRVMSRSSAPADLDSRIEWAQADVENGDGLAQVVEGVDVIVNSMSLPSNMQAVDIGGTRRLLEAGKKVGLAHVLHISIVGIERIPNPYYNAKVEAEQVVIDSGVPYSIWRATQFHSLLDGYLAPLRQGYTAQVLSNPPDSKYQLLDTREAAEALLPYITAAPGGRLPDVGGPEVLTLDHIIQTWLAAQGITRTIQYAPGNAEIGAALRQGYNTIPSNPYGKITWSDYLNEKYGQKNPERAG